MGNLITVYKGDENRAKIETTFGPEDFFSLVYNRAFKALEKIVNETRLYKEAHKPNGYKIRFQGMGNNTIIFTAERGQGKTSAMQSFAELLRNPDQVSARSDIMKSVDFHVLDAIDPSALDQKENIIRVLLSRLYFEFDKKYSDGKALNVDSSEKAHERQVLLKLLVDCYDNVGILRGNSNHDEDQDDLEHLAQMGNSAKLKENLNALIESFLKIALPDKSVERYLVIQIDDVDLSTGDIYDICEDIHRYFSIPNVIVLMAADYSQLRYALCERYLKQYKELQNERSKVKIYDKCHDMATRYLEKVFPEGHRIELPVLQEMTVEDYINLNILYLDKLIDKDDVVKTGQNGLAKVPENLCTYLLQELYTKTGIILLNTENIIHPLLPRTMRELTHFLNLLDEMPKIDFIAVCSNIDKGKEVKEETDEAKRKVDEKKAEQERENLSNNLSRVKRYYLYDWCTNYLDETQWDLIQAIDMCEPQRKSQLTVSLLSEYINKTNKSSHKFSVPEISYHSILREIENNNMLQNQVDFQYALFFYYTLFLNEWFTKALGQENSMCRFVDFVGGTIYYSPVIKDCRFNGYKVNSFKVSGDLLMKRTQKAFSADVSTRHLSLLKAACIPQRLEVTSDTEKESAAWINAIWNPEEVIDELYFDNFRLLEYILIDDGWSNVATDLWKGSKQTKTQDAEQNNSYSNDILEVILFIKNILTNFEVQQKIQKNIEKYCNKQNLQGKVKGHLMGYYNKLHAELDIWLDGTRYAPNVIKSNLGSYLDACLIGEVRILNDILLSNEENVKTYYNHYAENLINAIDSIDSSLLDIFVIVSIEGEKISDKLAAIHDWDDNDWEKIKPELMDQYTMPDDEEINKYKEYVDKIMMEYEKVKKKKNECFLLIEDHKMAKEDMQTKQVDAPAIEEAPAMGMEENAESVEEAEHAPEKSDSEIEQKCQELIDAIEECRNVLIDTRKKIYASRTRKS